MPTGALTGYVDVAQVVLYAFFIFFAGLVFWLRREDRREGYPLENEAVGRRKADDPILIPRSKAFHLPGGETTYAPQAVHGRNDIETGIPETPQQRLEIATKIVRVAGDYGIKPEDIVIDPLAMTVGAATDAVTITLETIRLIREHLGVNMSLGASNVSFGLPDRHALNAAFLPIAMEAGLTSAIMSTAPVVVESVRAADLLLGHDEWGARWIAAHRARKAKMADAA